MLTVRQCIEDALLHWLFAADATIGGRDPLVTLSWLVVIAVLGIAGLLTVCVWPLDSERIRPRRDLRREADSLPPIPAGAFKRERCR